jgi:hypothetical protein
MEADIQPQSSNPNVIHAFTKKKIKSNRLGLIVEYIIKNPNCSAYEISKVLKIGYATVSRDVRALEWTGYVICENRISEDQRLRKECFIPEIGKSEENEI